MGNYDRIHIGDRRSATGRSGRGRWRRSYGCRAGRPGSPALFGSQTLFDSTCSPASRCTLILGAFRHDTLIGQPWGSAVLSHLGHRALLLQPSLTDLMKQLKRGTQIIYPKDAAYIVYRLSLRAGSTGCRGRHRQWWSDDRVGLGGGADGNRLHA